MAILEIVFGIYCLFFVGYTLIFVIASFLYTSPSLRQSSSSSKHKIAVLVPAYKCDEVILNTVNRNLEINYLADGWKLFVIADGLAPKTIAQLKEKNVEVVEVTFEKSTKVRSLKKCLEHQKIKEFDSIVILDADNVMDVEFLTYMNKGLTHADSIQGQRVASNQNNSLAILDGISESINNVVYRCGSHALHLSVSLSGSGMAFRKGPLMEVLQNMDSIGGFDRELEFEMLRRGIKSSYLKEAIVFDEKTDEMANFRNQRTRWMSSHFVYLRKYFRAGITQLFRGNFTYFHSTVLRNLQLPRILNIGLITALTIVSLSLIPQEIWHWQFWVTLWSINTLMILVAIPRHYYNWKLVKAIFKLPVIIITVLLLLFRLKGANRSFIHTYHRVRQPDKK